MSAQFVSGLASNAITSVASFSVEFCYFGFICQAKTHKLLGL
jgi:hypothetical protein